MTILNYMVDAAQRKRRVLVGQIARLEQAERDTIAEARAAGASVHDKYWEPRWRVEEQLKATDHLINSLSAAVVDIDVPLT